MNSEQLKPEEFDAHIAQGSLRLALVGMSNAGKSYRAKVLRNESDFTWYNVDEEIAKELGIKIDELAAWMGYPPAYGYAQRESQYMDLENTFTLAAATQVSGKNVVFDTTGSVIHLPQTTLEVLHENSLIVHLDVGENSLTELIHRFFSNPKPVAWNGFFAMREGESEIEALRRSYPALLHGRLEKYRKLAHVQVRAGSMRNTSGAQSLSLIRDRLLA